MTHAVAFLLDVDNTLLDNDRVIEGLRGHLTQTSGRPSAARLWALFEQLRIELGYADYLGALQRDRAEVHHDAASDPVLQQRVPSRPCGLVDDQLHQLAAMKQVLGERLPTVFARQGHHAFNLPNPAAYPLADITRERIGDLPGGELPKATLNKSLAARTCSAWP